MRFLFISTFLYLTAPLASANEVWLKSGARAKEISTALIQATANLGGPEAGNIFQVKYELSDWNREYFETDARSLCNVHSLAAYHREIGEWRNADNEETTLLKRLGLDVNAPLAGIDVIFVTEGASDETFSGVSLSFAKRFDMRGLSKCQPLRKP